MQERERAEKVLGDILGLKNWFREYGRAPCVSTNGNRPTMSFECPYAGTRKVPRDEAEEDAQENSACLGPGSECTVEFVKKSARYNSLMRRLEKIIDFGEYYTKSSGEI